MSLAQIILPSPTDQGFQEWAFHHWQHHQAIIDAVSAKHSINMQMQQIWPISANNIDTWLEAHQFMHNQMNAILRVQGNDLSTFDWHDAKQREGFFYLNWMEHKSCAANTGLPI